MNDMEKSCRLGINAPLQIIPSSVTYGVIQICHRVLELEGASFLHSMLYLRKLKVTEEKQLTQDDSTG